MNEKLATILVLCFMAAAFTVVGGFGEKLIRTRSARHGSTGQKLPYALSWLGMVGGITSGCGLFGFLMTAVD